MTGGVRVFEPDQAPGRSTPEIDTEEVVVDGEIRQRQRVSSVLVGPDGQPFSENNGFPVALPSGLVPTQFDSVAISYNAEGEMETVTYVLDNAVIRTLSLTYTAGRLTQVEKTA